MDDIYWELCRIPEGKKLKDSKTKIFTAKHVGNVSRGILSSMSEK